MSGNRSVLKHDFRHSTIVSASCLLFSMPIEIEPAACYGGDSEFSPVSSDDLLDPLLLVPSKRRIASSFKSFNTWRPSSPTVPSTSPGERLVGFA
jgi:hypothetical protein